MYKVFLYRNCFLLAVESSTSCRVDDWGFTNFDLLIDQIPLFPKCNVNNHWSKCSYTISQLANQNI